MHAENLELELTLSATSEIILERLLFSFVLNPKLVPIFAILGRRYVNFPMHIFTGLTANSAID